MLLSIFTRTSSSVGAASMPLPLDREGRRGDRIDVFLAGIGDVDRLPGRAGDADRVANAARVVDRAGDDFGGEAERDADRGEPKEELGGGERAPANRHVPDD